MPKLKKTQLQEQRDDIFAEVYAATKSPSKAIIASEPALIDNKEYAKVKAQRKLQKPEIQTKITKKLELMSKKSLKQIDKMLTSDNEQIVTVNAWKTIEHIRGKPIARNINMNANASVEDVLANME